MAGGATLARWRDTLERRLLRVPPERRPRRALIAWWGLLTNGRPTVGDYLAVANLSRRLEVGGIASDVVSAGPLPWAEVSRVAPDAVDPSAYGVLAFTCGPLVTDGKLMAFVHRFARLPRVAVGVSVLERHASMNSLFDRLLARDGTPDPAFDLSLAAEQEVRSVPAHSDGPVAFCLRGPQKEYGTEACLTERAEQLLSEAACALGGPVGSIDTRVRRGENELEAIDAAFAGARLVLTTRLHGSLLALRAGVPFVAVDQIKGGAKVSEVLRHLGWPLVLRAENATAGAVVAAAHTALSPAFRPQLTRLRDRAIALSAAALDRAERTVAAALTSP